MLGNEFLLGYEFRSPVAVDDAPAGSSCEWCGKPAIFQLIAIGGKHHNKEGRFCRQCGNEFILAVADSLSSVIPDEFILAVDDSLGSVIPMD